MIQSYNDTQTDCNLTLLNIKRCVSSNNNKSRPTFQMSLDIRKPALRLQQGCTSAPLLFELRHEKT